MPVIFQSFENYPDNEQFSSDLDKIYGNTLNNQLKELCQAPDTRLYCGKFNGRWITAALTSETNVGTDKLITISLFYVREATRRRRVGSQLMEEIINREYLDKINNSNGKMSLIAQISEESSIDNNNAEAFLQSLKFIPDNKPSAESRSFIYQA